VPYFREDVILTYILPAKYAALRAKIRSFKLTMDAAEGEPIFPIGLIDGWI
jgi:hypothetical protein